MDYNVILSPRCNLNEAEKRELEQQVREELNRLPCASFDDIIYHVSCYPDIDSPYDVSFVVQKKGVEVHVTPTEWVTITHESQ